MRFARCPRRRACRRAGTRWVHALSSLRKHDIGAVSIEKRRQSAPAHGERQWPQILAIGLPKIKRDKPRIQRRAPREQR
jgi:hypothetical protein